MDQIGRYIKLVLEDAKEDFFKDGYSVPLHFTKKELREVFNVGSQIAVILKSFLEL